MRKARYRPPYTVSGRAMGLMAEIGAALERYRILLEGADGVRLRKANHVHTERGTTANATKGEEGNGEGKSAQKSRQKSDQKIADLMRKRPEITIAELSEATGLSASGVKKNIRKLKDANRIRRVGPDKGGHWEVA